MSKQPLPTQDEIAEFAQFMEQNPVKTSPVTGRVSDESQDIPVADDLGDKMSLFVPKSD